MVELLRNKQRIYPSLIILIVVTIINALLSRFAVIAWPGVPGVPVFYFAVAFMIAFTLWFGGWGAIAAYAGCVIGAGMPTLPLTVNLYWSLADLWQVFIPLVAFKGFHADIGLRTKRDFLIFVIFGLVLNNLVGAVWGSTMLAVGHVLAWDAVSKTLVVWFFGNLIVTILITPLLLRYVSRRITRWGICVKEYWF